MFKPENVIEMSEAEEKTRKLFQVVFVSKRAFPNPGIVNRDPGAKYTESSAHKETRE